MMVCLCVIPGVTPVYALYKWITNIQNAGLTETLIHV